MGKSTYMATVNCIKCKTQYNEKDEDAYLCTSCLGEKKSIADEVDAKFKNRPPQKPKMDFEKIPRIPGTNYVDAKHIL